MAFQKCCLLFGFMIAIQLGSVEKEMKPKWDLKRNSSHSKLCYLKKKKSENFLWCFRVVFLKEGNSNFYDTLLCKASFMSSRCVYASAFYFSPSTVKKVPKYPELCKWCLQVITQRMNQNLLLEGHGFIFVF